MRFLSEFYWHSSTLPSRSTVNLKYVYWTSTYYVEARTAKYIIVMLVQTSTSTASTISYSYGHRTAIRCESEAIVYNLDTALSSYVNTTIGLDYYYVEARDCEVHHCHARPRRLPRLLYVRNTMRKRSRLFNLVIVQYTYIRGKVHVLSYDRL